MNRQPSRKNARPRLQTVRRITSGDEAAAYIAEALHVIAEYPPGHVDRVKEEARIRELREKYSLLP